MSPLTSIERLPDSWEAKPLRSVVDYAISNVDKLSKEWETPIRLCNYTDVYNNEFITAEINFMSATASTAEIEKFGIEVDDVIITKDSESHDDIGVPTLVRETANDLVCGYHLALLRPRKDKIEGAFLLRCLQARSIRAQIELAANGITRFGVPKSEIGKVTLPVPSLANQRAIIECLDRETARLDALVATKKRVLNLLAEKRQTIITCAVTRGLDSHAALRESRIPWLGEIPSHWDIWKLSHLATIGNGSTPSRVNAAYWSDGTVPWLNSAVVGQHEVKEATQFVTEAALRECQLTVVKKGSVLVGIVGQGKTRGAATVLSIDATINQNLAHISPVSTLVDPWYLRWTLFAAYEHLRSISDDGGRAKGTLTCENLANLRVAIPPLSEQRQIVTHIDTEIRKLDRLLVLIKVTMELLKERRAALVSDAISGQLDVDRAV